jgi:hypothetical protein
MKTDGLKACIVKTDKSDTHSNQFLKVFGWEPRLRFFKPYPIDVPRFRTQTNVNYIDCIGSIYIALTFKSKPSVLYIWDGYRSRWVCNIDITLIINTNDVESQNRIVTRCILFQEKNHNITILDRKIQTIVVVDDMGIMSFWKRFEYPDDETTIRFVCGGHSKICNISILSDNMTNYLYGDGLSIRCTNNKICWLSPILDNLRSQIGLCRFEIIIADPDKSCPLIGEFFDNPIFWDTRVRQRIIPIPEKMYSNYQAWKMCGKYLAIVSQNGTIITIFDTLHKNVTQQLYRGRNQATITHILWTEPIPIDTLLKDETALEYFESGMNTWIEKLKKCKDNDTKIYRILVVVTEKGTIHFFIVHTPIKKSSTSDESEDFKSLSISPSNIMNGIYSWFNPENEENVPLYNFLPERSFKRMYFPTEEYEIRKISVQTNELRNRYDPYLVMLIKEKMEDKNTKYTKMPILTQSDKEWPKINFL